MESSAIHHTTLCLGSNVEGRRELLEAALGRIGG